MSETNTRSEDPDVWTEFETEEGACGSISEDGNVVWGAYCPQPDCGELNTFQGAPWAFAKRPYRCVECNWVSLMDESVREIEDSLPIEDSGE